MRSVFLFAILVFSGLSMPGQTQPQITCVDIVNEDFVEIRWLPADSPIAGYNVYMVGQNEPLNDVPVQDLFFSIEIPDVLLSSESFYVLAVAAPTQVPLDSASSIFLTLGNSGTLSIAELIWNEPLNPMPQDGKFILQRSIEDEPFQLIVDSIGSLEETYNDTLYGVCPEMEDDSVQVSYKLGFVYENCTSYFSNIATGQFKDLAAPPQPEVETILVDPLTGIVNMNWAASPVPDVAFYIMQRVRSDSVDIDPPLPPDSLQFSEGPFPDDGPYRRNVRAEDLCGNEISFNGIHSTIHLEVDYQRCSEIANLNWTPYEGWPLGVQSYDVKAYVDYDPDNPQPPILIVSLGANTLSFDYSVDLDVEYIFFIEANSVDDSKRSSTSNGVQINTAYPDQVSIFYLSSVSTNTQNQVEVTLYQPNSPDSTRYELFRAEEAGEFELIFSIDPPQGLDTIRFVDQEALADHNLYTYYWDAYDACNNLVGPSNEGSNILLKIRTPENNLENQLFWNDYIGWEQGVSSYEILRAEGDDELFLFDVTPDGVTDWFEDVEDLLFTTGKFCYQIQAIESPSSFGGQNVSTSNVSCVTREPLVWIPDAMVYGGFNDVFAPVLGFVDLETYRMEIYNKWGERIFETREIENGWDGTYKGNVVREDFYRYIISVEDGGGQPIIEEGRLYMIRSSN
ncbi:MAG: gliding motility-associated C-terminal domain-containing protein [Bacteroidota bacterium]